MRIKWVLLCPECYPNLHDAKPHYVDAELTDTLSVVTTCPKGHEVRLLNQMEKFEIFLGMGAKALMDSYFLESLVYCSIAKEDLYSFALKCMTQNNEASLDNYKSLKKLQKNSERILGAFSILYFYHFGSMEEAKEKTKTLLEKVLNQNLQELRNKCMHQGYIPRKKEAEDYAMNAYEIVETVIRTLKGKEEFQKNILALVGKTLEDQKKEEHDITIKEIYCYNPTYCLYKLDPLLPLEHPKSFQDAYNEFKEKMRNVETVK